ncbi:MAG: chromate transporter [Bacillota bacterium]
MLKLFITFFKIGALTFGGGYAMIPLMQKEIIAQGWLTQAEFLNIVAIAEMTPGPIAINSATFVGYQYGGIAGAALATFGVVAPSIIIMVIFSHLLAKLKASKYAIALKGIGVGVAAMIAAAVLGLVKPTITGWADGAIALAALGLAMKTKLSPIVIILGAGIAGVVLHGYIL